MLRHITNGYYRTNYISNLGKNLPESIETPIHEIAEYIFDNVYRQRYPAKFPHLFPKTEIGLLLNDPGKFIPWEETKKETIERESHGAQHVSNVAINAVIFLNLYLASGNDAIKQEIAGIIQKVPGNDPQKKQRNFIKYLQIAALYHDAGRHGEGEDQPEWENSGGDECTSFLMQLGCPQELAIRFGYAAAQKDDKLTDNGKRDNKDILKIVIQCADCLHIQRCQSFNGFTNNLTTRYANRPRTRHFVLNYLDIWFDATNDETPIPKENQLALQKEIVELALASRFAIAKQSDLENACPIEVVKDGKTLVISPGIETTRVEKAKLKFEHGGFKVVESFLPPFMRKWYNSGNLVAYVGKVSAANLGIENEVIANYIRPLQVAIDSATEIDQFTVSLINLKSQLVHSIEKEFANEIQADTFTQQHIANSKYANIPREMLLLNDTVSNSIHNRETRLNVVRTCRKQLQPVLQDTKCKVAAAVTFVLVAAAGAILGAAIGTVLGACVGSPGAIPGSGIGAVVGFALGAGKGWTIGCAIAAGLGLGTLAGVMTFWNCKHAGLSDHIHQAIDAAEERNKHDERPSGSVIINRV